MKIQERVSTNKTRNHILFVLMLIIFCYIGCYYVYESSRNIVFMDYWRNIVWLIPSIENGDWSFDLFWNGSFGQRNPLILFLVALNIKFFNLNCQWESYAGMLLIGIISIVLYVAWNKLYYREKEDDLERQLLYVPLMFIIFNLNQWEILSLQFSFAFMLRICCYISIFVCMNKLLIEKEWEIYKFFFLGVYTGVVICLLSQLYFPALLISIGFVLLFNMKECEKKQFICYCSFIIPVIISIVIYFWDLQMGEAGTNGMKEFLYGLFNGDVVWAILYMLVGSLIPQTVIFEESKMFIIIVGLILIGIIVYAICIFFIKKMYRETWLPVLMVVYGLMSILIITYGRLGYGAEYMSSSRYVCETNLIWVGCGIIHMYNFSKEKWNILKTSSLIVLIILIFLQVYCDRVEMKIAPSRGIYKDELLLMLEEPQKLYEDEKKMELFQSTPELVKTGIRLLEEYSLNIYGK